MTGNVKETYLSDLHSRQTSDGQESLAAFSGNESDTLGTVVSVVTEPIGGIVDASDEHRPELGMPKNELDAIRETREELDEGDVESHNTAIERLNIEQKYKEYIRSNTEALETVQELVERVSAGETITLVCFEKEPKWCHRHVLKREIERKVSDQTRD